MAESNSSWSGVLRLGVTNSDPVTLRGTLPKFACPDLTNKDGCWAKALAEKFCTVNTVLHLYLKDSGELYYGINGVQKGLFLSGINVRDPLWLIVDIYGNSTGLQIMDACDLPPLRSAREQRPAPPPRPPRPSIGPRPQSVAVDNSTNAQSLANEFQTRMNLGDGCNRRTLSNAGITPSASSAVSPARHFAGVNLSALHFHNITGKNISLNGEKNMATRVDTEYDKGYVFLDKPIAINQRIVVQMVKMTNAYTGGLGFGMTVCDPLLLRESQLPSDSHQLMDRPEYWVVVKDIAGSLCPLDELAFHVDKEGQVHMSKNSGATSVVVHVDPTQKMWPFFDLYGNAHQMRLLGSCMVARKHQPATPPAQPLRVNLPPATASMSTPASSNSTSSMRTEPMDECSVCLDNRVDCVLYKCGHQCLCYSCANEQKQKWGVCPMCRAPIDDVIRTFKS